MSYTPTESYAYNYVTLSEKQKKITESIQLMLVEEQMIASRVTVTADDSVLFEFKNAEDQVIIDVYEHVVVVLRTKGEHVYSYAFKGWNDVEWNVDKVKDALHAEL